MPSYLQSNPLLVNGPTSYGIKTWNPNFLRMLTKAQLKAKNTVKQLRAKLATAGLPTDGLKAVLVDRLHAHLQEDQENQSQNSGETSSTVIVEEIPVVEVVPEIVPEPVDTPVIVESPVYVESTTVPTTLPTTLPSTPVPTMPVEILADIKAAPKPAPFRKRKLNSPYIY